MKMQASQQWRREKTIIKAGRCYGFSHNTLPAFVYREDKANYHP